MFSRNTVTLEDMVLGLMHGFWTMSRLKIRRERSASFIALLNGLKE
jgi:hypothetical protein